MWARWERRMTCGLRPGSGAWPGASSQRDPGDITSSFVCALWNLSLSHPLGAEQRQTSRCPSFSCSPFNDRPMCRICHEGSSQEDLLSPCECTGTLGTIHRSCLEHWLSSSNTSYCELCHFRFAVERKPRPLVEVSNWGTS